MTYTQAQRILARVERPQSDAQGLIVSGLSFDDLAALRALLRERMTAEGEKITDDTY